MNSSCQKFTCTLRYTAICFPPLLLVNRKILILHYKDRHTGMVLAFELQFLLLQRRFHFSRLFCSCSCFVLFFLVIYYLVGAYKGLGRAFYITYNLFFLLNRSYSKLLFWIAPFKFFLFLLLPMSASTYHLFCYLRTVQLSFQNSVNKLLDCNASGPH